MRGRFELRSFVVGFREANGNEGKLEAVVVFTQIAGPADQTLEHHTLAVGKHGGLAGCTVK